MLNNGVRVGSIGSIIVAVIAVLAAVPGSYAQTDLYVANLGSDDISVVDTNTDQIAATIPVGSDPDGIAVLSNGAAVFVANFLGDDVSVIDPTSRSVTATIPVGSGPVGVAASSDSSRVYVANRESNTVSVIDTAALRVIANITVGDGPNGIAVRPDGGVVYVTNSFTRSPGVVSVIDAGSNQVIDAIAVNHSPGRVAFTPDGELAYVTNYRSHNVSVIDARSHDVVATVPVAGRATNVAFSPDGTLAYITTLGGRINVIETTTHSLLANIGVGVEPYAIATLASGDRAYTADLRSNTSTIIDTIAQGAGDPIAVGTLPFALAVRCVAVDCAAPPLTPRPTRTATPSATITPTRRPSSTPRPTRSTPTPLVIVSIGSAQAVGDSAVIEVRLDGDRVGGFQNDIVFDNTVLALEENDCVLNPAIGLFPLGEGETSCLEDTSVGPCKNISKVVQACGTNPFIDCVFGFGPDHSFLRAIVAALAAPNNNEIPSGVMYTCTFRVLNHAALPTTLYPAQVVVSDPFGTSLPSGSSNGFVLPGDTTSTQPESAVATAPTPTLHPAWTPTSTPPPAAIVSVGSARPDGDKVVIDVRMQGDGVGGFQNDIIFDSSILSLDARDCVINPAIGLFPLGSGGDQVTCLDDTGIGSCKTLNKDLSSCSEEPQPHGCPEDASPGISRFRAILAATAAPNPNVIPSGVAYTCTFHVLDHDALPTALVIGYVVASDPFGERMGAAGIDGAVLADDVTSQAASSTSGNAGGCNLDAQPARTPWYPALLPIVLLRRRAHARAQPRR